MSVKSTDEILAVFSVELVVQEHKEGGPIVAITSLPEFKPSEAFSLFKKLQIKFKGGKESPPLINLSLRGTVVRTPA